MGAFFSPVSLHITQIHILDASINGDALGFLQRGNGCWREVLHLVAWEETAEVERSRSEAIGDEPLAHPSYHGHIVINGRYDEVRQFYPHTSIPHGEDGVENRLKVTATNTLVDFVAEGFQVYIGGIEIRQQVGKWFLTDIASRHENIPQSLFMCQTSRICHIFYIGKRFSIGVGDAWTMVL